MGVSRHESSITYHVRVRCVSVSQKNRTQGSCGCCRFGVSTAPGSRRAGQLSQQQVRLASVILLHIWFYESNALLENRKHWSAYEKQACLQKILFEPQTFLLKSTQH